MKPLSSFKIDLKQCVNDLDAFDELLSNNAELKEREHILPFFRDHPNLTAYIGSYAPGIAGFSRLELEYQLYGDFAADAIVGDPDSKCFCLIEFEDGCEKSIFKSTGRSSKEWAPRFEHGFSQVIDWFWKIDDLRQTASARTIFGHDHIDFMGVLVIGRDRFLDTADKIRLEWRVNKVVVNSQRVVVRTFDQLASDLRMGLSLYVGSNHGS
jgi:hypothetical protein